jgi:hypothetical protein
VPDADFADLVNTRLSLSLASWGGEAIEIAMIITTMQ